MSDLNREKGAETGTSSCPNCGAELALAPQPDGSVAAEACGSCYDAEPDTDHVNTGAPVAQQDEPADQPAETGDDAQKEQEDA